jgi:hypothetical protein
MSKTPRTATRKAIDAKLKKRLTDASAQGSVEAVFTLKTPEGQPYLSGAAAREAVDRIVAAAAADTKVRPTRLTVFPNVQSFALSGPPALVRRVAQHDDVASATANHQDEDMLIRPVESRPRSKKKR